MESILSSRFWGWMFPGRHWNEMALQVSLKRHFQFQYNARLNGLFGRPWGKLAGTSRQS